MVLDLTNDELSEEDKIHKKFAVNLFNRTWDLLAKKDRTEEEIDEMIHSAHASRYHWGQIGKPIHFERGEWQISRVYSVLNKAEPALHHAKRCLDICTNNDIGDFDIAFAYEAMARAYSVAGNNDKKEKYLKLAKDASDKIEKEDDKKYFLSELESIKWYLFHFNIIF